MLIRESQSRGEEVHHDILCCRRLSSKGVALFILIVHDAFDVLKEDGSYAVPLYTYVSNLIPTELLARHGAIGYHISVHIFFLVPCTVRKAQVSSKSTATGLQKKD